MIYNINYNIFFPNGPNGIAYQVPKIVNTFLLIIVEVI